MLTPVFQEAAASLDKKFHSKGTAQEQLWLNTQRSPDNSLFIHWEYHPRDVSRRAIRQIFEQTLAPVLAESGLPVSTLTIAYSTPKSIGQCLTKTQLEEPSDMRVSSYIEPMDPPANL